MEAMTPEEAVDAIVAAGREIAAAHEAQVKRVLAASTLAQAKMEAERVARVLEHEAQVILAASSVVRKDTRSEAMARRDHIDGRPMPVGGIAAGVQAVPE